MSTFKSIGAVIAGFITVVILSVGTDFVLETIGAFPPQSEPASYTWWMLLIAFVYRSVYTIAGGYVTATAAPKEPMRHTIVLGIVGIAASTLGTVTTWDLTPHHWYPVALVVFALPCTWLGGKWRMNKTPTAVIS